MNASNFTSNENLVDQLRKFALRETCVPTPLDTALIAAADELDRLTARNAKLVKALEEAKRDARRWRLARQYVSAMTVEGWQKMLDDGHAPSEEGNSVADDAVDQMIARAALKESTT